MISQSLIERVKLHEGFRSTPYLDTVGVLTVGYGRNLEAQPFTEQECAAWLIRELEDIAEEQLPTYGLLELDNKIRREVLVEMQFNLGETGLQRFRKMFLALAAKDFDTAAAEMLDSKWARQVGQRAVTLANLMRAGKRD